MVIEILVCKVKKEKVDEFLKIERKRKKAMKVAKGCFGRFILKHPSVDNIFLICTKWRDKRTALNYCGKRLRRVRFQNFVERFLEGIEIVFYESVK